MRLVPQSCVLGCIQSCAMLPSHPFLKSILLLQAQNRRDPCLKICLITQMSRSVPPPTNEELSTFHKLLSKTGKPTILSLQQEYSDAYILDYSKLSTPLCFLFDEMYLYLPYPELLERCEEVFEMIQVSTSQAKNTGIVTQAKVRSKILWFIYRAGRVTASKFKSAAHTSMVQPFL